MTRFDPDLGTNRPEASHEDVVNAVESKKGIDNGVVEQISLWKGEPSWMSQLRLDSLRMFDAKPMAEWFAVNMPEIDFDDIQCDMGTSGEQAGEWDESEVGYRKVREDLEEQGILFCDMNGAVREHPHLVHEYLARIVPPGDNKFAALNTAVWSGGTFIYVPPNVDVEIPLQASLRGNSEYAGQFERTLIIADKGSKVHYIEGCSAPVYSKDSVHSAVVEIVVKEDARVTYTTIQNWSKNVYNLVTKRARVETRGHMEWIDGNIGSRLTMTYPTVHLVGDGASGGVFSLAYAGEGQHQDVGAKMIHAAPNTTSKIVTKSISKDGGITTYRGLVRIDEGSTAAKNHIECDALILDDDSVNRTRPCTEIGEPDAQISHQATESKITDDQRFYLMSRGLTNDQAIAMIVNGFIEPITRMLPMEYAVEWSRLIEMHVHGSVG
ncbi:MAG: Fe-S cluster assembly protein SufB [Ilumatobacter sp.]|jgi:Fe-S cluster assembly protein SufB